MMNLGAAQAWTQLRKLPPEGTIVHVVGMAHLTRDGRDEYDLIPGGLFAEVKDNMRDANCDGHIEFTTMPCTLLGHASYGSYRWDQWFPVAVSPRFIGGNCTWIELPPEHVQDAVRAFVALHDRPDNMPVVVEDGWLC